MACAPLENETPSTHDLTLHLSYSDGRTETEDLDLSTVVNQLDHAPLAYSSTKQNLAIDDLLWADRFSFEGQDYPGEIVRMDRTYTNEKGEVVTWNESFTQLTHTVAQGTIVIQVPSVPLRVRAFPST